MFLRIKAPLATFRTFSTGYYRPSYSFITPSAAYGLIANLVGIDTRSARDLPTIDIAIGAIRIPSKQILYQQLHEYLVSGSKENEYGTKPHIFPARREILVGIDAYLGIRAEEQLLNAIRLGLESRTPFSRGLPFLGDNNFLIDVLREERGDLIPAYWYQTIDPERLVPGMIFEKMTLWIDYKDSSKTKDVLLVRSENPSEEVPDSAWISVGPKLKSGC